MKNTDAYWSGAFYERFIDPQTQELRDGISECIPKGSSVIDFGCGTGALAFSLSEKCEKIVGVDFSPKMIKHACKNKEKKNCSNVDFIEADASDLSQFDDQEFDVLRIGASLRGRPTTSIQISGSGQGRTQQEAIETTLLNMKRLQTVIATGSLPVKLEIVKLDTISPILGKDFLKAIFMAFGVAILAVVVVVFVRYKKFKPSMAFIRKTSLLCF